MHGNAPLPVEAAIVGLSNDIRVGMRKGAFDSIGAPPSDLVQKSGSRRPRAVRGYLSDCLAQTPERLVDRIFAKRSPRGMKSRKHKGLESGQRLKLAEVGEHLSRQRNGMRSPHLHPLGRQRPHGIVEVDAEGPTQAA